jgi:hypothetical protein
VQPLLEWKSSNYYILWVCVFVALGIQHVMHMHHIILSYVACPAVQYFSTLSHEFTIFRKKSLLNIKCVFWFSLQLLCKTPPILRRIQWGIIVNVHRSSCKVSIILVRFLEVLKYKISQICIHWEVSCYMWTGRCDKAKSLFTVLHTLLKTGSVLTAIEFQAVVCPYLKHRKDIWCQFHTLKKLLLIHIEQLMNGKHTVDFISVWIRNCRNGFACWEE